ncbi:MAG: hypothetical protein QNI87_03900 [Erythrobacter sp.]|uniref:hypothetical protein n=1 Tax=Erythrobacter sp. TaxID=1042 RepID=UPI002634C206|nr:hypothetical protein [Erythrobacter sp.]MDJ0977657.1 hypothetical protein [Erythrobacter sp.]
MDILLSSNSRGGYSQSLVDLLAKPVGFSHQFRYALDWIDGGIKNRIGEATYHDAQEALILFVDQKDTTLTPVLFPIRFAKIVGVHELGSTVTLTLELGEFCKTDGLSAFNSAIRALPLALPDYNDQHIIEGRYWLFGGVGASSLVEEGGSLGAWEGVINGLSETPNFNDEVPFYRFTELRDSKTAEPVSPMVADGRLSFELRAGRKYEIEVYHFHPRKDFPDCTLRLADEDDGIRFLNGSNRVLDTRYDRIVFRFKTIRKILGTSTDLSFQRVETGTDKLVWQDFQMGIEIKPSWGWVIAYIAIVAIGFAAPFIVRSYSDPNNNVPVIIAAAIAGLIVGLVTIAKEKLSL